MKGPIKPAKRSYYSLCCVENQYSTSARWVMVYLEEQRNAPSREGCTARSMLRWLGLGKQLVHVFHPRRPCYSPTKAPVLFPSPLPAMCTLCKYLARPPGDRPTPFQLMAVNEYMDSPARNVMVQSPPESRGTPMAMLASLARVNIAVGKPQVDLRGSDVTSSRRITI